jgi:hypothetical protein
MELHSVSPLEAERLVLVRRGACESHGALRQVVRVAVPLQRRETALETRKHGVGAALVGQLDGDEADLRLRPRVDPCPE